MLLCPIKDFILVIVNFMKTVKTNHETENTVVHGTAGVHLDTTNECIE